MTTILKQLCILGAFLPLHFLAVNDPTYKVYLVQNGKVIATTKTNDDLSFCFFLKKGIDYSIEINGKVNRSVKISTQFSQGAPKINFFKFYFKDIADNGFSKEQTGRFDENCGCFYLASE